MAELFTPTYGFVKPQPGTGEPAAIEKINSNFDKADKWAHAIWVNDGVTPPTADLIEGATVAELTSGKVWIAKKNIGGTFDKKYVRYPWSFTGYTSLFSAGNGWGNYGLLSFGGASNAGGPGSGPVNSSAADIVGTRLILPVTGIYSLIGVAKFTPNGTGTRALNFNLTPIVAGAQSPGAEDINTGVVVDASSAAATQIRCSCLEQLPAGQPVTFNAFQNSGGALTVTFVLFATLIQVTG